MVPKLRKESFMFTVFLVVTVNNALLVTVNNALLRVRYVTLKCNFPMCVCFFICDSKF